MSSNKAYNIGFKKRTLEMQEDKFHNCLVAYFVRTKHDYETLGLLELGRLRHDLAGISYEHLDEEKINILDEKLNDIAFKLNDIFINCVKLMTDEFVLNKA